MKARNRDQSKPNDAFRVLLALVFILFASIASRENQTPEKVFQAQEVAADVAADEAADVAADASNAKELKRARSTDGASEEKRKLSGEPFSTPNFTHINGSI